MRGGSTLNLEFPFWKLPFLIVSAFKGVNFQKRLFTSPLDDILGPFSLKPRRRTGGAVLVAWLEDR